MKSQYFLWKTLKSTDAMIPGRNLPIFMQAIALDHCGFTGSLNSMSNHLPFRTLSSCTSHTHEGFGDVLHEMGMLKILTHKIKNFDMI